MLIMHPLLLAFLTTSAFAQSTVDPETLEKIFGTPPTPIRTTPGLDSFTIKPTDSSTNFVDKNGNTCKCVPYYLCDPETLEGTNVQNASVTGWGVLDIRFGEDDCQQSVEKCCTNPKTEDQVVTPVPDQTRMTGCGYRNPKGVDFTISGGTGSEAEFGEFPWVVALMNAENDSYAGVGVLIHPQVVMTGAHIASRYSPGYLKIRAGEWDTQTTGERLKHQERLVREIYIHSAFRKANLFNDVALLRLEEPVVLAEHINVICLPNQDESFDQYTQCVANGWGKDIFGKYGSYAVILKKLEVDMVPHDRCSQLLRRTKLGQRFNLHSSFVCAGGEEGKDTCTGDGGAPLACRINNRGDRYKLTGLVAWGIGCGGKDVPAVYANVPAFRRWVDDKMAAWGYDTRGYTA